jgi:hypothetical protein
MCTTIAASGRRRLSTFRAVVRGPPASRSEADRELYATSEPPAWLSGLCRLLCPGEPTEQAGTDRDRKCWLRHPAHSIRST